MIYLPSLSDFREPRPACHGLVDFMQRKLIYHVMPNLLKLGVASQKTFTMQESFQINKQISKERMKERKKERKENKTK